jgi:hypothetical protein
VPFSVGLKVDKLTILGFIIAMTAPLSVLTAARLDKSGETARLRKEWPLSLLVMILGGMQLIIFPATLLYFSWAHLNWVQLLVIAITFFYFSKPIAFINDTKLVWILFSITTPITFFTELYLILV